jgi:undecaprenyl-diphosphatase
MHPSWWLTFLQIILESLPISSSTHIAFFASRYSLPFEQALDHAVHGITLIIIILFWREKIKKLLFSSWHELLKYSVFILLASLLPTLFFFSSFKEKVSSISPLHGILTTAVLLALTSWCSSHKKHLSIATAVALGIAQSIALIPGISRMGITYSCGRFLRYSPQEAFWLSCLIEIPLCIGGILLAVKKYTLIIPLLDDPISIVLGISVSALLSYGSLYCTYIICTQNKTWIFSLYLVLLAFLAL